MLEGLIDSEPFAELFPVASSDDFNARRKKGRRVNLFGKHAANPGGRGRPCRFCGHLHDSSIHHSHGRGSYCQIGHTKHVPGSQFPAGTQRRANC